MNTVYYVCEECGYQFEKTELYPDIEDAETLCPWCGGTELQRVEKPDADKLSA